MGVLSGEQWQPDPVHLEMGLGGTLDPGGGALGGAGCLSASPGEWLAQGAAGETSLPALRGYGSEGMEVKKGTQGASLIPVVEGCCHPPSYRWRWLQPPVAAFDQSRWREGRKGLTDTPEPPHTRPPSSSPCRKGSRCSPFLSDAQTKADTSLCPTRAAYSDESIIRAGKPPFNSNCIDIHMHFFNQYFYSQR